MKHVWTGLFSFAVILLVVTMLGCQTKAPSSENPGVVQDKVIARVGSLTISQTEFVQAYQQWGHGKTPQQFLQNMVDEALLYLEASRLRLQDTDVVHGLLRKGMVRTLLHRDFERWFTPDAIDILKVRKYYNENIRDYYRPVLAQVVHLLVRFPSNPRRVHTLKDHEKKILPSELKKVEEMAQEFLRLVHQHKPRTKGQFVKLAGDFVKAKNTPDPNVVAWHQSWVQEISRLPSPSTQQVQQTIHRAIQDLHKIPFCENCDFLRTQMGKLHARWLRQYPQQIPLFAIQEGTEQIRKHAITPRNLVTTEDLPPFPEKSDPHWPSMVDEFVQATFALSDKQYSNTLCKTMYGYHILFRVKTLPSFRIPLLQAAPKIRRTLFEQERVMRYKQWLRSKYRGVKTVGYLTRLQPKPRK